MWWMEGDRGTAQRHESEGRFRAVEPVGAAGDETDLVVERFCAALVDLEVDGLEDPVAVAADCLPEPHQWL